MKVLVAVAHPDDETLFAYQFITENPSVHIACCHIDERPGKESRINDFFQVCVQLKAVPFLAAGRSTLFGIDTRPIKSLARDYDLIVTHNSRGEYGHPAHVELHHAMVSLRKPMRVFSSGIEAGTKVDWEAKQRVLALYRSENAAAWLMREHRIDVSCEGLIDQ